MDTDTPEVEHELRHSVLRRAKRVSRIPLLPESAGRILQISRQPTDDVNIAEMDRLITRSPTLASRLLSVANSTYYSMLHKVTTVRQAIITLGLRDTLSLILVTSLMDKLESGAKLRNLDPLEFRTHAIAAGAAARAGIAHCRSTMLSPVEVNLAGLLHDIGRSIFIRFFPSEFDQCLANARDNGGILRDREFEVFGIAHDELGGILAEEWKLPDFILQTIKYHHHIGAADEAYRDAILLVAWSNSLLRVEHIGQAVESPEGLRAALATATAEDERMSRMLRDLDAHQKEILAAVHKELDLAAPPTPESEGLETVSRGAASWGQGFGPPAVSPIRRFLDWLMDLFRL